MGDNPVKTRRQPWKKQLTGDNPVKKQKAKETTLEKTINGRQPSKKTRRQRDNLG